MKIHTLTVGQLQTNCYLAWDEKTQDCLIIDPGDEGTFIVDKIQQLNLKPQLVIATHGHFDHLLGVLELKLAFNIPFALHAHDLPHLKKAHRSAQYWLSLNPDPIPQPDTFLKNQQLIPLGRQSVIALSTPGHTPGGICLYSKNNHVIFTGDTLFSQGGVGRTDLPGGNPKTLQKSIIKILKLPSRVTINPGHGLASTIKAEAHYHLP